MTIRDRLFALGEADYKAFNQKLLPTVDPDTVIGVRVPALRALARELAGTPEAAAFMAQLPHTYFEENNLHAFLIERLRGFDEVMAELTRFLPYIDNWATCDMLSPPVFKRYPERLAARAAEWIADRHCYTVRYGVGMYMKHCLGEHYRPEYPAMIASIRSEEYYVRMMIAWYFATALAARFREILPYIAERRLDPWVHNKAIQKAIESRRITPEQKRLLRSMRINTR